MSSQSQNEPRRDLVPNVDSELSQASLPGTLRPREQLSFREQIEQGAGRAIVALESLPVIVEFFGAARGEGAGVGPHGISFSTLDERLRGSVLPTEIEGEGAALFNSRENVVSFLRAHAARIEAAPVEEQVKFFDEAQAKIIAALDQAKYDIYCLLDKTRCGPREESDDGEIKSYLLMAKVLGQLYQDGMPRPHLPHLEEIIQRGQESLQRTSEAENPPTRMPVDTAALAPLPEPMRDACNRMFNAVGRFVSPEMVLEHRFLREETMIERDSEGLWLLPGRIEGAVRPEFGVLAYLMIKELRIDEGSFFNTEPKPDTLGQLIHQAAESERSKKTEPARQKAKKITDLLKLLEEVRMERSILGYDFRETLSYNELLRHFEGTFGYSLLEGAKHPAWPTRAIFQDNTASTVEASIFGLWILSRRSELTVQEQQLLVRLLGASAKHVTELHSWWRANDCLGAGSTFVRDGLQDSFPNAPILNVMGLLREKPPEPKCSLGSFFRPFFKPDNFRSISEECLDLQERLKLRCGAIRDRQAIIRLHSCSSGELEKFISWAEKLTWEFGVHPTELEDAFEGLVTREVAFAALKEKFGIKLGIKGEDKEELRKKRKERDDFLEHAIADYPPSLRQALEGLEIKREKREKGWALTRDEYRQTYNAACAFISPNVPLGYGQLARTKWEHGLPDYIHRESETSEVLGQFLRGRLFSLLDSKDHSPRALAHAAFILRHIRDVDEVGFRRIFDETVGVAFEALGNLLENRDPCLSEAAAGILFSTQIRTWMEVFKNSSAAQMEGLIERGITFAVGSEAGRRSISGGELDSFFYFLVSHVYSRFGTLSTKERADEFSETVDLCLHEAMENVLAIWRSSQSIGLKEIEALRSDLSLRAPLDNQLALLRTAHEAPSLISEHHRFLARILQQIPVELQWGVAQSEWTRFFERVSSTRNFFLDAKRLASSNLFEWLGAHFFHDVGDVLLTLEKLSTIVEGAASRSRVDDVIALLGDKVRECCELGFGMDERLLSSLVERILPLRFRGYVDNLKTSILEKQSIREETLQLIKTSSYLLETLRRMKSKQGDPTEGIWETPPPLVRELKVITSKFFLEEWLCCSQDELDNLLQNGPGLREELGIIQDFFGTFAMISAPRLFELWRSLALNSPYKVWDTDFFWSESRVRKPEDWRSIAAHLPTSQTQLVTYVREKARQFVLGPDSFRVSHALDREIAGIACGVLGDLEWRTRLGEIEFTLDKDPVPGTKSVFDEPSLCTARAINVPGVSGKEHRNVNRKALIPGGDGETVFQRFTLEKKLFSAALTRTPLPIFKQLSDQFGVEFPDGEREVAYEDTASVVHAQALKLAERISLSPSSEIEDGVLRDIFYAHVLSDHRMNGSAVYTDTREDEVERLAAFVELVTAGRTRPEWQEVLSRCNPELRARFDQLPDVTPLYGPLIERVNYSDPKAKPVELTLCLSRGIPSKFIGHISDSCARDSLENHRNIGFVTFAENIKDKIPSFSGGFMLIDTKTEEGDRALIIRGYNPSKTLIAKLQIKALFETVVDYAEGIARELGCTQILAPRDAIPGLAFSNRALGHIGFNIVYRDAQQVRVPRETTTYNDLVIDDKCVLVRAVKPEDKGKTS